MQSQVTHDMDGDIYMDTPSIVFLLSFCSSWKITPKNIEKHK